MLATFLRTMLLQSSGVKEAARFSKMVISYYITIQAEDYTMDFHCHENLKSHLRNSVS